MLNNIRNLLFTVILGLSCAAHAADEAKKTEPLSDLSLNAFESKKMTDGPRDPFSPGAKEGTVDPSTLSLEGIISSTNLHLALVSGKIVREGDSVGSFLVKEIDTGSITVQSVAGLHKLETSAFLGNRSSGGQYDIVFQNAELKDAVNMIGAAGKFNIIAPQDLAGKVSVIFEQTTLKDALASILRVNKLEFAEENNILRVGAGDSFPEGTNLETQTFNLRYAAAKDLVETIKEHVSDKGSVAADDRTNSLIIQDNEASMARIAELIRQLDKQDTQVHIEAKIVDVTRNFSQSMGIQWGFTRDTGRVQGFSSDGAGGYNVNLPADNPTSGVGLLVGNVVKNTNLSAELTMAEGRGDAHIISQPSISTLNNVPAKIRSGVKFYVKSTSTIAVGGSSGTSSGSESNLEEIDTGIELSVTPQITPDSTVKLKIAATESEADFTRAVDGIPAVVDNVATTTIIVNNGETAVIGGLMKVNKSKTTNGVPVFSTIPIFGALFKSKVKNKTDNELLIFITPRIMGKEVYVSPADISSSTNNAVEKEIINTSTTNKKASHKYD
ncbi:hypothetical protein K1X76_09315, partial [bacterium]|nr:hypothetical protein [bacterium]